MTRTVWFMILGLALYGCGSDGDDGAVQSDNDDSEWIEMEDDLDDVETGAFSLNLPGEAGPTEALCSLVITRVVGKPMATIMLTLDVIGEECDVSGCDDPNMQNGTINYNGGIEGDKPFATMVLGYEPPSDPEVESMWMYNAIYKTEPFSRFEMWVDGEPFNILTSDIRGADDYSKGPHLWDTKIDIEADMLQSPEQGDQATPGIQTRGKFSYQGGCEVIAKSMQL